VIVPSVNFPVELDPLYTFPRPQEAIVVVPPARTTAPPTTPTAVGTLVNLMLFRTREPAPMSTLLLGVAVRTKTGVLVTVASMIASAPMVWWYRHVSVQIGKQI
jgi:hypothetical protein